LVFDFSSLDKYYELVNKFRFKDFKLYSNPEVYDSNHKYKTVFSVSSTSYIYGELEIYNKMFEKEDWNLPVLYGIYDSRNQLIKDFKSDNLISENESRVKIIDGWGSFGMGSHWKEGEYIWKVFINDVLISNKKFYVENPISLTRYINRYFKITEIGLFQGKASGSMNKNITYLKTFQRGFNRYVSIRIKALNLVKDRCWPCEMLFTVKNSKGDIKARFSGFNYVKINDASFSIIETWSDEYAKIYDCDSFIFEVMFLDCCVARIPFRFDDFYDKADPQYLDNPFPPLHQNTRNVNIKKVISAHDEINSLVALHSIKSFLRDQFDYLRYLKIRSEIDMNYSCKAVLHSVFTGNPGTGKTTVAKLLGKVYKELGYLSKGHVYEAGRAELIAEYLGQTAPKVKSVIAQARGGVLFIDEAYCLARDRYDRRDFGNEVIEILLKEMSDGPGDLVVIVAGYPDRMEEFLVSNPGLKSRFRYYFDFPDYDPDELMEILKYLAQKKGLLFGDDAEKYLYNKFVDIFRNRDNLFGNARYISELLEKAEMNLGIRYSRDARLFDSEKDIVTLRKADFEKVLEKKNQSSFRVPVNEEYLNINLKALDGLTGLKNVKNEINEIIKFAKYTKNDVNSFSGDFSHYYAFIGNPGTGKTTVARILSDILKSLGILEKGHLIECDRQRLVGQHIGETAIKTSGVIKKAMGGMLLIDEAYSLSEGIHSDFGMESIETILKMMENHRGEFSLICSGYPDKMVNFLNSNPGFKSRFDKIILFDDFNSEELFSILMNFIEQKGFGITNTAKKCLYDLFYNAVYSGTVFRGNARDMRNIFEQIIKKHIIRFADIHDDVCKKTQNVIDVEDLIGIDFNIDSFNNYEKGTFNV